MAPERLNEFTQTFGGPIQRDKTFFFLSYQNMGLREPFLEHRPCPIPLRARPRVRGRKLR